jgi:hypothetical protein
MPDDVLKILIAHELAHPALLLGYRSHSPEMVRFDVLMLKEEYRAPEHLRGSMYDDEETEVRELQDGWGFSEETLLKWEEENGPRLLAEHQSDEEDLMREEVKLNRHVYRCPGLQAPGHPEEGSPGARRSDSPDSLRLNS